MWRTSPRRARSTRGGTTCSCSRIESGTGLHARDVRTEVQGAREEDDRSERDEDERGVGPASVGCHKGKDEEEASQHVPLPEQTGFPRLGRLLLAAPPVRLRRRSFASSRTRASTPDTRSTVSTAARTRASARRGRRRAASPLSIQPISGTPPRRPSRTRTSSTPPSPGAAPPRTP